MHGRLKNVEITLFQKRTVKATNYFKAAQAGWWVLDKTFLKKRRKIKRIILNTVMRDKGKAKRSFYKKEIPYCWIRTADRRLQLQRLSPRFLIFGSTTSSCCSSDRCQRCTDIQALLDLLDLLDDPESALYGLRKLRGSQQPFPYCLFKASLSHLSPCFFFM